MVVGMLLLIGEVLLCFGLCGVEVFGGGYCMFFVFENGFVLNLGVLNYGGCLFGW